MGVYFYNWREDKTSYQFSLLVATDRAARVKRSLPIWAEGYRGIGVVVIEIYFETVSDQSG